MSFYFYSLQKIFFSDLGRIDYLKSWQLQEDLLQQIVQLKLEGRNHNLGDKAPTPHYLLFCEHPHVYTLGKSGSSEHLLINQHELLKQQTTFIKTNRGGDITYHGPGQIVGYPILNLDLFFNDVHLYVRNLEEVIIRTIAEYGIVGTRIPKLTGVWIDGGTSKARKICAFGVRCSRWVTMHGWALNVNTQLEYFNHIVPCGIIDKSVTSLQLEIGKKCDEEEVKAKLLMHFTEVFHVQAETIPAEQLLLANHIIS